MFYTWSIWIWFHLIGQKLTQNQLVENFIRNFLDFICSSLHNHDHGHEIFPFLISPYHITKWRTWLLLSWILGAGRHYQSSLPHPNYKPSTQARSGWRKGNSSITKYRGQETFFLFWVNMASLCYYHCVSCNSSCHVLCWHLWAHPHGYKRASLASWPKNQTWFCMPKISPM